MKHTKLLCLLSSTAVVVPSLSFAVVTKTTEKSSNINATSEAYEVITDVKPSDIFANADSTIKGTIPCVVDNVRKEIALGLGQIHQDFRANIQGVIVHPIFKSHVTIKNGSGQTVSYRVTKIQKYCFYETNSLYGGIELPAYVRIVEEYAFANCSSIQNINFDKCQSNLQEIRNSAFQSCSSLVALNFCNCVALNYIGDFAFDNCRLLSTVWFPHASLGYVGYSAFTENVGNACFYFQSPDIHLVDGWGYTATTTAVVPEGKKDVYASIANFGISSSNISEQNPYNFLFGKTDYNVKAYTKTKIPFDWQVYDSKIKKLNTDELNALLDESSKQKLCAEYYNPQLAGKFSFEVEVNPKTGERQLFVIIDGISDDQSIYPFNFAINCYDDSNNLISSFCTPLIRLHVQSDFSYSIQSSADTIYLNYGSSGTVDSTFTLYGDDGKPVADQENVVWDTSMCIGDCYFVGNKLNYSLYDESVGEYYTRVTASYKNIQIATDIIPTIIQKNYSISGLESFTCNVNQKESPTKYELMSGQYAVDDDYEAKITGDNSELFTYNKDTKTISWSNEDPERYKGLVSNITLTFTVNGAEQRTCFKNITITFAPKLTDDGPLNFSFDTQTTPVVLKVKKNESLKTTFSLNDNCPDVKPKYYLNSTVPSNAASIILEQQTDPKKTVDITTTGLEVGTYTFSLYAQATNTSYDWQYWYCKPIEIELVVEESVDIKQMNCYFSVNTLSVNLNEETYGPEAEINVDPIDYDQNIVCYCVFLDNNKFVPTITFYEKSSNKITWKIKVTNASSNQEKEVNTKTSINALFIVASENYLVSCSQELTIELTY